jgi:lipoprotein NlpD
LKHLFWLISIFLAGCATSQQAPVIERAPSAKSAPAKPPKAAAEKDWRPDTYTVKKGDTLYSIGLEFGFDYKEIAQWNNIQAPYVIHIGRQLKLKEGKTPAVAKDTGEPVATPLKTESIVTAKTLDEPPLYTDPKAFKEPYSEQAMKVAPAAPFKSAVKPVEKPAEKAADTTKPEPQKTETAKAEPPAEKPSAPAGDDEAIEWSWPVNGKVLTGFNDAASAKGIDIGGNQGQPVLAAAPGKVVYSGSSLRGYGKLVIIKHNKTYLSAYAHNSQILVKEGQEIAKGQKIAEMGSSDTDRVKLHFEIRKLGKPVDPAKYLPVN